MQIRPVRLAACAALATGLVLTGAPAVQAAAPAAQAAPPRSAPVELDRSDPDLQLGDGAELADPKVLDIRTVVEDGKGEERREETNEDVTFALQAEVLFPMDSAKLSAAALGRIETIADEIDDQEATRVRVFGFTDDLGSDAHGEKLSRERAESVRRVLSRHLDPSVVYDVRGYGEDYPIADNSTEEGRKKNRRVEITFDKSEDG
ncbi:OmpA family protein [Streptomyces capparidis]